MKMNTESDAKNRIGNSQTNVYETKLGYDTRIDHQSRKITKVTTVIKRGPFFQNF